MQRSSRGNPRGELQEVLFVGGWADLMLELSHTTSQAQAVDVTPVSETRLQPSIETDRRESESCELGLNKDSLQDGQAEASTMLKRSCHSDPVSS